MNESAQAWPLVVEFMRRRSGVVLRDDQSYLLGSRLGPIVRELGYRSILDFVHAATAAQAPPRAAQLLLDAMTTHETSFFRDPAYWEAFTRLVVPALRAAVQATRSASIWCAACSTGQEPYSIAMLLEELEPAIAPQVRILGTDVSPLVIERARLGSFSSLEVGRGLGERRLAQHFDAEPGGHRVKAYLRQRIDWEAHNLLGPAPSPNGCDVVLCRNVLIYFDSADRNRVVTRLFGAARAGGFVGVGTTELLGGASVSPGWYVAPAAASVGIAAAGA